MEKKKKENFLILSVKFWSVLFFNLGPKSYDSLIGD